MEIRAGFSGSIRQGLNGERKGRGRGGEGGLTRSYLLLRTSDFHWTDASCLRSDLTPLLTRRHLDCSTPVSRRRTPDKQWLPYNCFYSSLNAKYSILFLLLDGSVVRSSGNRLCKRELLAPRQNSNLPLPSDFPSLFDQIIYLDRSQF